MGSIDIAITLPKYQYLSPNKQLLEKSLTEYVF